MKLHQEAYNSCTKTSGETTAEKLSWSEQMTKVSVLRCLNLLISYNPHAEGADYPSKRMNTF